MSFMVVSCISMTYLWQACRHYYGILCHLGWHFAYPWHIYGELRLADWKRDLQGESLLQTGKIRNLPFLCIDSFVTTSMSNYMNTEQAFFKKKNPKVLLDKKHQGKFSLLRCPCILVCEYKMLQNATFKKKSFLKVFFLYRLPQMAATSSVFSQQTRPETLRDGTRFFTSVNLAIESISVSLIAPSCWKIKKSMSIISAPK